MSDNTEVRARLEKALLMDWFRKIGASLSDEDYEAGIEAIAQHEAAIRRDQIEKDAQIAEQQTADTERYSYEFGRSEAARTARGEKP